MELNQLSGIITGASSGLGLATASVLAAAGCKLVLIDRDGERLEKASKLIEGSVSGTEADVTSEADVSKALDVCETAYGPVRFAVNCAGISSSAKIVSKGKAHDYDLWKKVIDVNLSGTFNVMRLAAERMVSYEPLATKERGVIVNTSSVAATDGQRGHTAYSASKAGIIGMSLPVARELREFGVRCVAIAPGLFETPIFDDIPPQGIEALKRSLLFPERLGKPAEFAQLVAHVITNSYLNATCIRLDGGARLS